MSLTSQALAGVFWVPSSSLWVVFYPRGTGTLVQWSAPCERLPRQLSLSAPQALTAGAVCLGRSVFRRCRSKNRSRSHLLKPSLLPRTSDSKDLKSFRSRGYIETQGGRGLPQEPIGTRIEKTTNWGEDPKWTNQGRRKPGSNVTASQEQNICIQPKAHGALQLTAHHEHQGSLSLRETSLGDESTALGATSPPWKHCFLCGALRGLHNSYSYNINTKVEVLKAKRDNAETSL